MNYLFFDTETTGFPSGKRPLDDPKQPYIVQLAAILTDEFGAEKMSLNLMLDCGVEIPKGAYDVHGMDKATLEEFGVQPRIAINMFVGMLLKANLLVAHNLRFDLQLIKIAMTRSEFNPEPIDSLAQYCTMEHSTNIVKCPPTPAMVKAGRNHFKVPKLQEAYLHFMGEEFEGAHDALADVRACIAVFNKIQEHNKAQWEG